MRIISHRANLHGPAPDIENTEKSITEAIKLGFDVEIDLRKINDSWMLGHDAPKDLTSIRFLRKYSNNLWVHAKNIETLYELRFSGLNYFFHDVDDSVLTSKGWIWCFPGKQLTPGSIAVMPESSKIEWDVSRCAGVCSDYPVKWAETLK